MHGTMAFIIGPRQVGKTTLARQLDPEANEGEMVEQQRQQSGYPTLLETYRYYTNPSAQPHFGDSGTT
jgi:predicted AAA+ superfamily ATPase